MNMQLDGVLFFPVTPFGPDGALATEVLAAHLRAGLEHGPGGGFIACGTGEFPGLSGSEYARAVHATAEGFPGAGPVTPWADRPDVAALPLARSRDLCV